MAECILTSRIASISELKKNPMGVLVQGEGHPEPQQACVPVRAYEELLDQLKDIRKGQERIRGELDEL